MQCTSSAYFFIEYTVLKRPSIWKSCDLHYIIEQDDTLLRSVGIEQPFAVDELSINFKIENFDLNGVMGTIMGAILWKTKMTFLKTTGTSLKETFVMVQLLTGWFQCCNYIDQSFNVFIQLSQS